MGKWSEQLSSWRVQSWFPPSACDPLNTSNEIRMMVNHESQNMCVYIYIYIGIISIIIILIITIIIVLLLLLILIYIYIYIYIYT